MINKTQAIVLRVSPFSKTSHIVTWMTPFAGKIGTVIKGAVRPKSPFLGQYDLFYTCELLYYKKEVNGLHIAKECTPLELRKEFRSKWKAAACASYFCDMIARTSMIGHHQHSLYELLALSLDFICKQEAYPQLLLWFELKLAECLGFSPQINACTVCGTSVSKQARRSRSITSSYVFSAAHGGIVCSDCARTDRHIGDSVSITPDILAMLWQWQSAPSPRSASNTKCTSNQLLAFLNILGIFIDYHITKRPVSRRIAMEMVIYKT